MKEYKREIERLNADLKANQKKSLNHDDHLRVVDAWWTQVIISITSLAIRLTRYSYSMKSDYLQRTISQTRMPIVRDLPMTVGLS